MSVATGVAFPETLDYFERIEMTRAIIEKTLNFAGYTPFTCTVGGLSRIVLGLIDTIQFSVRASFSLIADLFSTPPKGITFRCSKHLVYAIHASGNVIRGFVELFPFIINNIALLYYDCVLDGRRKYPVEYKQQYIDPYIATHQWMAAKLQECFPLVTP